MKSRLSLLALVAFAASAQVNLTIPLGANVYSDLLVHWLDYGTSLGTLNADIANNTTTVVLTGVAAAPAVGQTFSLKRDPFLIASIVSFTGGTLTVTVVRSTYSPAVAAAHTANEAATLLAYPTPTALFISEAAFPWASKNSMNLGNRSVAFGATFQ